MGQQLIAKLLSEAERAVQRNQTSFTFGRATFFFERISHSELRCTYANGNDTRISVTFSGGQPVAAIR